jgi:hypothetical protein
MDGFRNLLTGAGVLSVALCMAGAERETFSARLSPVAMDASMRANIAGSGSASATLIGSKLTIDGTFEGMLSNATQARIYQGPATGVRGKPIFDLTVTRSINGKVAGAIDLGDDQKAALRKGCLSVQIDSEKAPDGNLWGWLLTKGIER